MNAAIISSIVGLATALDMETTAEGVETHDDLALIRRLGCSHVQGYIYGRPMDLDSVLALLADGGGRVVAKAIKARASRSVISCGESKWRAAAIATTRSCVTSRRAGR